MSYLEDTVNESKLLITESAKLIPDMKIRNAIIDFFHDRVPDYFWIVQASSTGKNHPKFSGQIGGLVRHTATAANYAVNLYNSRVINSILAPFSYEDLSKAIAAILIHDTFKLGYKDNGRTVYSHGSIAADEFYEFATKNTTIEIADIKDICHAVSSHMGHWGRIQPNTDLEKFVSLCDYLSAQKEMEKFYESHSLIPIEKYSDDTSKFLNFIVNDE